MSEPMKPAQELVERLRTFPKFYSLDGAHWLRSGEIEPTCIEAAKRIEELERELAAR